MEDADLRRLVTELREQGSSLNEILDTLHNEHDVRLTFLDLRMLVAEIEDSKPVEKAPRKEEPEEEEAAPEGTHVEVDAVMQPGAQLSGRASLASGAKIQWAIDAHGRLNLGLEKGSPQPTEQDMTEFQQALTQKLRGGA